MFCTIETTDDKSIRPPPEIRNSKKSPPRGPTTLVTFERSITALLVAEIMCKGDPPKSLLSSSRFSEERSSRVGVPSSAIPSAANKVPVHFRLKYWSSAAVRVAPPVRKIRALSNSAIGGALKV